MTATALSFLNVIPLFVLPYSWILMSFVYVPEIVAALILCGMRGTARQIGTGIAASLVAVVGIFVASLVVSSLT
ncbi:hypothetical protein [Antrihabitans cavernicola]|uniref:Uncharacterized protein n=1 Tax=Antrihabitans cavernicola TaxID=2495913 RepID=A0A5A7S950_9NOCA|nr:hypothetical protein [Spelaeibacter cavernicola]KAA0021163.1 hypothetical protein FOY51_19800 [Spelaeibacter cavernicola]